MNNENEVLDLAVFYLTILLGQLEEILDGDTATDPDTGNAVTLQCINAFIIEYGD